MLFHHWPENEAEQQWRGGELDDAHGIADHAEDQHHHHVKDAVVDGVDADADEHDDGGIEDVIRDGEHPDPDPDQRHVQDDQQDVADPEAHHQPPEHLGTFHDHARAGRDAVHHQHGQ